MVYMVMAKSKGAALEALKKHFQRDPGPDDPEDKKEIEDDYLKWKDATIDNLPDGYRIMEYGEGDVFVGEWA